MRVVEREKGGERERKRERERERRGKGRMGALMRESEGERE